MLNYEPEEVLFLLSVQLCSILFPPVNRIILSSVLKTIWIAGVGTYKERFVIKKCIVLFSLFSLCFIAICSKPITRSDRVAVLEKARVVVKLRKID
jgi:hypothetical protein